MKVRPTKCQAIGGAAFVLVLTCAITLALTLTGTRRHSTAAAMPVAIVYDGAAACEDCTDAVADALGGAYTIVRAGDADGLVSVTAALEKYPSAAVFVQPGGGDDLDEGFDAVEVGVAASRRGRVLPRNTAARGPPRAHGAPKPRSRLHASRARAWPCAQAYSAALRAWVHGGGAYVGICMGGYLAGDDERAFKLIANHLTDVDYTAEETADVKTMDETFVTVQWRAAPETIYFQGGPSFEFKPGLSATERAEVDVVARYANGQMAAAIMPYGAGAVGVLGPHPEAPEDWCASAADTSGKPQAAPVQSLFREFVEDTIARRRAASPPRVGS